MGTTRYEQRPFVFRSGESERGILFTSEAGFLDLAHIRVSMDWVYFLHKRVYQALAAHEESIRLAPRDGCEISLKIRYPSKWNAINSDETLNELSIAVAARVTFDLMTWHEIASWFGYGSFVIWSEKASAFTYEDTISHLVGIRAAVAAIKAPQGGWNVAATRSLSKELELEGLQSKTRAMRAVAAAKGHWWINGRCIRRFVEIGEQDQTVRPWLISPSGALRRSSSAMQVPSLVSVQGWDATELYSLELLPTAWCPSRLSSLRMPDVKTFEPRRDYPRLLEIIRREVKAEFGDNATEPWE